MSARLALSMGRHAVFLDRVKERELLIQQHPSLPWFPDPYVVPLVELALFAAVGAR